MKKISKKILVINFSLLFAASIFGQTLPYKNGFENATENTLWTLVTDQNNASNSWAIGSAQFLSGSKSLYVSSDNGTTADYLDAATSVLIAYRDFTLPAGATYSFYFDYRNYAQPGDTLFVCWIDDSSITIPTTTNGTLPSWVSTKTVFKTGTNKSTWTTCSFKICSGSGSGRLAFVWKKHTNSPTNNKIAAYIAIDNIQLNLNTHIPYFSGFDNAQEQDGWILYNTYGSSQTNVTNRWCFGNKISLTDSKALYISYDDGAHFAYKSGTSSSQSGAGRVSAVKEFVLPVGENFRIDFDWIAAGDVMDFMYVIWMDAATDSTFSNWAFGNATTPQRLSDLAQEVNLATPVTGSWQSCNFSPVWQHATFSVTGTGRPAKLIFYWVNNGYTTTNPPAAVDNVSVTRTSSCSAPIINSVKNVSGNNLEIDWDYNPAYTYQIAYKNTYDTVGGRFIIYDNDARPNPTYIIPNLPKGAYSVFVRKFCTYSECGNIYNDTTAWATVHQKLIITGDGCINYTDLMNPAVVTPSIGYWKNATLTNQAFSGGADYSGVSLVDNGPNSAKRQTVCTFPKYDENTLDITGTAGLLTVPYGALATVRIGNAQIEAQCEGLTYNLHVDSTYKLLTMRYACVLNDPGHNPSQNNPHFLLQVTDKDNNIINSCSNLNFVSDKVDDGVDGWHISNVSYGGYPVKWKEWTTIGLNLSDYVGQNLNIKVSSWDCNQSGHFGYGYFMLDCNKAELKGLSCGNERIDTLWAPDGFDYYWCRKYNLDGSSYVSENTQTSVIIGPPARYVSTNQWFSPASTDTFTYICRVVQKKSTCYFNLIAHLAPRWPDAAGSWKPVPENCINYVQFTDESVIRTGNNSTEPGEDTKWIITNSPSGTIYQTTTEKNPKIIFPDQGATYNVTLISGINNMACADTITFQIKLNDFGGNTHTDNVTKCDTELPYIWRKQSFSVDAIGLDTVKQATGCDSIYILDFKVAKSYQLYDTAAVCNGKVFVWPVNNKTYDVAGDYSASFQSASKCDSIWHLHLAVDPVMKIQMLPTNSICADDTEFSLKYNNLGGSEPTNYSLIFNKSFANVIDEPINSHDIVVTIDHPVRPDKYNVQIKFNDSKFDCGGDSTTVQFEVKYPSYTIEQNWSDVIAVLNKNYNDRVAVTGGGGFEFDGYQWYKNGKEIPNAKSSYLYVPGGLEVGADYQVLLKRKGESYSVYSCTITAKPYNDKNELAEN